MVSCLALLILAARLVINEAMIRPLAGGAEWIELHNIGDRSAWLAGLSVEDARARPVHLPASADSLEPGGFRLLVSNVERVMTAWPALDATRVLKPEGTWPTLNDSDGEAGYADLIVVRDGTGALLDSLAYPAAWLGDAGFSIERVDPRGATILPGNWSPSEAPSGATPLAVNSIALPSDAGDHGALIVPGVPLVPGRGGSDSVIGWRLAAPGTISLELFDLAGRSVRLLRPLAEAPTIGHLQWDGRDDSGRSCPPGVYVVLLEGREGSRTSMRRWSRPIVLAGGE